MKRFLLLAGGAIASLFLFRDSRKNDEMTQRERVVSAARGELGKGNWRKYLSGVADDPGARVSWCGIFALWALNQAGIAHGHRWIYGRGFVYPMGLPRTDTPRPGDIAYLDQPYQHHAIVESAVGDTITTIDGNQAGDTVQRRVRPRSAFTAFYSIEPLLGELAV
jgi:hypothetical protein